MTESDPKQIFTQALDLAPEARIRFLDEACADNAELRGRVEDLLAAHGLAASFLENPQEAFRLEQEDTSPGESEGQKIGRYKLLQQIGEGGFGTVWMAEQQAPVRRMVALKIIKRGMDTRRVIARFEAERQALAMMDHPNIAKVLDGGETPGGRPFFVMELVRGVPITEFCDAQHLEARERLELFTQVCHAVHHAHQKGILHRDIKPSNILVTLHDGVPVPKVIDFGIAKATHQPLTEKTLFTEFRRMVGTPEYMAPEQAEMSGLDVDTRADIYSLGVLLYELLTGTKPLEMGELLEKGYVEVLRVLKEDDPHKPSTRVSTLGQRSVEVARRRRTDPGKLGRLLRGDVDWMVMKALEKDRARRYESAAAFAADVRRHLDNEPVLAGPPSRTYKLLKYVRRNRVGVAAAAAVLLALVVGAGAATWGFLDAREQAEIARTEASKANTFVELVEAALTSADPHELKDRDYKVRQLLDDFARELGDRLVDQPEVHASILRLIGNAYVARGLLQEAKPHLDRALSIRRELGDDGLLVESLVDMANWLHDKGEYEDAFVRLQEAEDILDSADSDELVRVSRSQSDILRHAGDLHRAYERASFSVEMSQRLHPADHLQTAKSLQQMASVRYWQGQYTRAMDLHERALEMKRSVVGDRHPSVASSLEGLGVVVLGRGGPRAAEKAEEHFRDALRMRQDLFGESHPAVASSLMGLGFALLHKDGAADEAEKYIKRSLAMLPGFVGDQHPDIATCLNYLGQVCSAQGKLEEAERYQREALEMNRAIFGEKDHPKIAASLLNVGLVLVKRDAERAEDYFRQALDMYRNFFGKKDHPRVADSLNNLGQAFVRQGLYEEAEPLLEEALDMRQRLFDGDHVATAVSLHNVGSVALLQNRLPEAEARLQQALGMLQRVWGDEAHPKFATTHEVLGEVLFKRGRPAEAEAQVRQAFEMNDVLFGPDNPQTHRSRHHLADALHALAHELENEGHLDQAVAKCREELTIRLELEDNQAEHSLGLLIGLGSQLESEEILRECRDKAQDAFGDDHPLTAGAMASLGKLLVDRGDYKEAEPLLEKSLAIRKQALSGDSWLIYSAMSLLGASLAGQGEYEEAEPLLKEGYEGMNPPAERAVRKHEAGECLAKFYDDTNRPEKAAELRARLNDGGR